MEENQKLAKVKDQARRIHTSDPTAGSAFMARPITNHVSVNTSIAGSLANGLEGGKPKPFGYHNTGFNWKNVDIKQNLTFDENMLAMSQSPRTTVNRSQQPLPKR